MAKLSIIVATAGRPTLARMTQSMVVAGVCQEDEVVVVTDGPVDMGSMLDCLPCATVVKEHPITDDEHRAGLLRNLGMSIASKNHLLFMDDDDMYTPGAIKRIRYHISRHPARPLMFRMVAPWGETLWRTHGKWRRKPVSHRNVGTPMFVVPRMPDKLGVWGAGRSSDWHFISTTLAKWPQRSEVLVDDTICVCNPEREVGW